MLIIGAILGAILGGMVSFFISQYYYNKTSVESQKQYIKIEENFNQTRATLEDIGNYIETTEQPSISNIAQNSDNKRWIWMLVTVVIVTILALLWNIPKNHKK